MRIALEIGDVYTDLLANFRSAKNYKVTMNHDWKWGHIVQINQTVLVKYKAGTMYEYAEKPVINVSHMGVMDGTALDIIVERC